MNPHRLAKNIRLRPAVAADLDALVALEQLSFTSDRLSRSSLRRMLRSPAAAAIVAVTDEAKLVGYALVLFRRNAAVGRLYSFAVEPGMAGQGIGSALLAAAESAAAQRGCATLRLEVAPDNPAVGLYRRAGYREFGRHPAYYEDGRDALRLEKRLTSDVAKGNTPA